MIVLKSKDEVSKMAEASRIVALALEELEKQIRPGMTTQDLDRIAEEVIRKEGGIPAFKGYREFPATLCVSINDEVVHGIPSDRKLEEGDIVGLDLGAVVDGYYGDSAITLGVGRVSEVAEKLIRVTEEALAEGIEMVRTENRISDIGHAVQKHVEAAGFSVVRDYVGHGIGRALHEDPQVPNFGSPGSGPRIREGMVLAIEPMVNAGGYQTRVLDDRWTVVTKDGSLSAHFEHTIAATDNGPVVLTKRHVS
jgi:methionyl aminopeptidase